jgi:Bacterial Ig-like domain/RTX calcium-binding nonapeptide repeat (4 copies)
LTVNETNGQQLIYNDVSGNVAGDTVAVASDNSGGALVYWVDAPAPSVPVTFSDATATYYQTYAGNWLPSQMIDGIISTGGNGWAIYRDSGQSDQTLNETALLTLASPVAAGSHSWTITINQDYVGGGGGAHLLGDFSLSYTTDATPNLSSVSTPFTITAATSLNGSTLMSLGNGQLLDSGPLPITDVYTITLTSNSLDPITGIVLGAINDPTNGLPTGGPGRFYGNGGGPVGQGNFVVSELTADVSASTNAPMAASISAATDNAPLKFGSNYFEYISDPGISWAQAKAAAASMTYLGATGYLATATSTAENSFLDNLVTTTFSSFSGAWLGGEVFGGVNGSGGSAYWEVGPLAGQLFSVGQSAVPGSYANWGGAEPNDSEVFSTVYMNVGAEGWGVLNGQWADAKNGLANGDGVSTGDNMVGYFVEFTPGSVVPSLNAGRAVTVTVNLTESVIVTGIPTLQLNDNEVATYTKGTGTNTLTFIYTVQPNDNVADLQVTGLNLPSGATIQDAAGNNLSGSVTSDLGIQIDTTPPAVTEGLAHDTGSSSTDKIALTGSGDPNAVLPAASVSLATMVCTPSANAFGVNVHMPLALAVAVPSTASLTFTLDTTAPVPVIKTEVLSKSGAVTLTGTTAEANDAIAVYDGTTLLGTTTTARNGAWSFPTGKISDVVHTYTATATDVAGNVGHSSNEAILGSTKADTLLGTSGNDIINGNGGNDRITGGLGADTLTGGSGKVTFVYSAISDSTPSGHDTITDFNASRDIIDFANIAGINAHGGIAAFEGKLTGSGNLILNAHSVAYIEVNGNTEVLVNTTNTAETVTSANASAADMEIVLVGIHLGLKSADFHHV